VWEWLFLGWIAFIPVMIRFNLRFLHRYTLPLADLLFVGALAAFLVALLCGARRLRPCAWYLPLLAYAGALILSTLTSEDVRRSAPKLAGDIYLILAAALAINYATSLKYLRRVVFAWLAGTVATILGAASGVILFFSGVTSLRKNPFLFTFGTLPPGHYPRIRSLFLNANMMCGYTVASVVILIAAREAGWISRAVFRTLLLGAIATAIFSLSPELGGLFLVLALWQSRLQAPGPRARFTAAAGALAAILFFMSVTISPAPLSRTTLMATLLHPEPGQRVLTWIDGWHTFLAHPWTGRGLDANSADVHYVAASGIRYHNTVAHNTWLSIMAQQGLTGLVAFLWVVLHLVRRFRLRGGVFDKTSALRMGLELALIGGFLYPSLTGALENTRHVWALMGLVAAVQEFPVTAD